MDIHKLFKTCKDKYKLLEILKQKPDLNIQNDNGNTVALLAFIFYTDKEILLEVLKQKPDLNIQDNDGYTVSMYAFRCCSDNKVLLELLKHKPDLTLVDIFNKTVLDYVLRYNQIYEFHIIEKLYNENSKQDKQLFNPKYIKLRNKNKVLPLILFRHQKRYNIKN